MGRRPRSFSLLALLVVVASGCIVEETDALSAGEVARNEELERLATSDRGPLIDAITQEGSEFVPIEVADPAEPVYGFSTCRAGVLVERDRALAVIPSTDWDVDRADEEGATMSRLITVVWGGGGDDESQAADEYRIELTLVAAAEGCSTWTLAFADTLLG